MADRDPLVDDDDEEVSFHAEVNETTSVQNENRTEEEAPPSVGASPAGKMSLRELKRLTSELERTRKESKALNDSLRRVCEENTSLTEWVETVKKQIAADAAREPADSILNLVLDENRARSWLGGKSASRDKLEKLQEGFEALRKEYDVYKREHIFSNEQVDVVTHDLHKAHLTLQEHARLFGEAQQMQKEIKLHVTVDGSPATANEAAASSGAQEELVALRQQIETIEKEKTQQKKAAAEKEELISNLNASIVSLRQQISTANERYTKIEPTKEQQGLLEGNALLQDRCNKMQEKLDTERKAHARELEAQTKQSAEAIAMLTDRSRDFEKQMRELKKASEEKSLKIIQQEQTIVSLQQQLVKSKEAMAELEEHLNASVSLAAYGELQAELQRVRDEISMLNSKPSEAQNREEDTTSQLNEKEIELAKLKVLSATAASQRQTKHQVTALNSKIDELEKQIEQEKNVLKAQKQNASTTKPPQSSQAPVAAPLSCDSKERIAELEKQLQQAKAALEDAVPSAEHVEALEKLNSEIAKLRSDATSHSEQLAQLQSKNAQLLKDLRTAQAKATTAAPDSAQSTPATHIDASDMAVRIENPSDAADMYVPIARYFKLKTESERLAQDKKRLTKEVERLRQEAESAPAAAPQGANAPGGKASSRPSAGTVSLEVHASLKQSFEHLSKERDLLEKRCGDLAKQLDAAKAAATAPLPPVGIHAITTKTTVLDRSPQTSRPSSRDSTPNKKNSPDQKGENSGNSSFGNTLTKRNSQERRARAHLLQEGETDDAPDILLSVTPKLKCQPCQEKETEIKRLIKEIRLLQIKTHNEHETEHQRKQTDDASTEMTECNNSQSKEDPQTKLTALREQLDAKQSDLRKLETEVETRKTALQEAARAFETERASLQSRIETLERDISEAASKSTNALQKHDSVVEDRDHLRTQLSAKEAECAKLLAQVKQQAASLSEGKKSSEQKDAKLSQLAGKLSETEATLSQSVPAATLKEVQSEKLALETKLAALREQLDAKQSDLRKLETEVETRKTALQEAARAFETERASLQSRIETLERDISEAASKSTNALQKHDSVVEDRDHLRTQLSAKEAECAKLLAQVKQQAASLSEGKKSSEQKDAKLSQLAGKLSETEATLSQSVPAATLKEVQSEKLALETKLAALREQLDAKQSDLRKLETEVETRKTALQEAARAFETERASLQSRIETLERDISEAASKSTNALQKHDSVVEDPTTCADQRLLRKLSVRSCWRRSSSNLLR